MYHILHRINTNKNTIFMPNVKINNKSALKPRDFKTLKRIEAAAKSSVVLKNFFVKGFKNFASLRAIVNCYYPEIPEGALWDFWHFRTYDNDICDKLEIVLEKLNAE